MRNLRVGHAYIDIMPNQAGTRGQDGVRRRDRAVAIGVTGHRALAAPDRAAAGVDEALRRIEETYPGRPFAVVSALAEGADRLVVQRVFARSEARLLVVVLPLPSSEYLADFDSVSSRDEFARLLDSADEVTVMDPAETRDEAYAAAGFNVLDRSDVLIAVWDGHKARGIGGTADIVAEVRHRGVPLAWVHAGRPDCGTEGRVDKEGLVTFERFPDQGP